VNLQIGETLKLFGREKLNMPEYEYDGGPGASGCPGYL